MSVSVLILAAGFSDIDFNDTYPFFLSEINGVSLLERIMNNVNKIDQSEVIYVLSSDAVKKFHLDNVVKSIAPNSRLIHIPVITKGSLCTALLAASQLNENDEILIISVNELVEIDLNKTLADFRRRGLDGGVLTFESIHPRYSYVRTDSNGLAIEFAQQDPISSSATAGIFWFARVGDFISAAKNLIRKEVTVNDKFYIAPAYNELILIGKRVGVFELSKNLYHPLKNTEEIRKFLNGK